MSTNPSSGAKMEVQVPQIFLKHDLLEEFHNKGFNTKYIQIAVRWCPGGHLGFQSLRQVWPFSLNRSSSMISATISDQGNSFIMYQTQLKLIRNTHFVKLCIRNLYHLNRHNNVTEDINIVQ